MLPDGIEVQTHHVKANLKTALAGLCLGLEPIVMARIDLTRFKEDYEVMNASNRCYFSADRLPARTCVDVTGLPVTP